MILYALIMHDGHDIDQSLLKKKKNSYPNFFGHVRPKKKIAVFPLTRSEKNRVGR